KNIAATRRELRRRLSKAMEAERRAHHQALTDEAKELQGKTIPSATKAISDYESKLAAARASLSEAEGRLAEAQREVEGLAAPLEPVLCLGPASPAEIRELAAQP